MRFRAGVDIGGTFTDFALYDAQEGRLVTGKRLTTPHDPSVAALAGLFDLLTARGATAADVAQVLHATTLATNVFIERRGGTTALIVTRGYEPARSGLGRLQQEEPLLVGLLQRLAAVVDIVENAELHGQPFSRDYLLLAWNVPARRLALSLASARHGV